MGFNRRSQHFSDLDTHTIDNWSSEGGYRDGREYPLGAVAWCQRSVRTVRMAGSTGLNLAAIASGMADAVVDQVAVAARTPYASLCRSRGSQVVYSSSTLQPVTTKAIAAVTIAENYPTLFSISVSVSVSQFWRQPTLPALSGPECAISWAAGVVGNRRGAQDLGLRGGQTAGGGGGGRCTGPLRPGLSANPEGGV